MNKELMIKKLKGFIYSEFGTAKSYAESKGVSSAHISAILRGVKEPTKDILDDISLIKVKQVSVTYNQA